MVLESLRRVDILYSSPRGDGADVVKRYPRSLRPKVSESCRALLSGTRNNVPRQATFT